VNVNYNARRNSHAHHTNEFDITDGTVYDVREFLVVRRGQEFDVIVAFSRPFDPGHDDIKFRFELGMFNMFY